MSTTIMFSQYLGVLMVTLSLGMLFNSKYYKELFGSYKSEPLTIMISAIIFMIIGLYIVLNHNIWEANYKGLITFIGWATLIKSFFLVVCPKSMFNLSQKFTKHKKYLKIVGIVYLAIGIYLVNVGFNIL